MNLTSKKKLKKVLKNNNLSPVKKLGQNFLINKQVVKQLIQVSNIASEETVVEIGPGLGILTKEIKDQAQKVIAIEKDKKLAKFLKQRFSKSNVEIIAQDFLNFKLNTIPSNYKVIANLPFYISSPAVKKLLQAENQPNLITLIIQKEVAERIAAQPPKMNFLAILTQFYCNPKKIADVSKNDFWPSPDVKGAILQLQPDDKYSRFSENSFNKFFQIVEAGFRHPRKQIKNNLTELNQSKEQIVTKLEKLNIDPKDRPEDLKLKDWIKLTKDLSIDITKQNE